MYFAKMNTQELHHWVHYPNKELGKWEYSTKDGNKYWYFFYNALHKKLPANEKIVDWIFHYVGDIGSQMWAYIMRYNRR